MTGEMSKADVTRDAFPVHFAIAEALGGEVRPFDVYQGPYVNVPGKGRLWLIYDEQHGVRVFNELNRRQTRWLPFDAEAEMVEGARRILRKAS